MRLLNEIQNLMGNYHVKSGMYHYYRNEYTQAVEFLRKALKDPKLTEADQRNARYYLTLSLLDLAQRLRSTGDVDAGVEQLRQAAEVSPDFPDIHYRLGRHLEELGRLDEAVAEYRAATCCQSDFLDAHVALAFCLLNQGKHDETGAAFRQALKIKMDQIQGPFDRGMDLLAQGELTGSSDQFHEVFRAVPQLANACLKKALDWLKAEEHEKALAELDRALERNPKYPDLHNFRGVVLCELDRTEEAIEAFRLSAALRPRYLVPRLNLAFALVRVGEYKQAEAELEGILEVDPQEPAAIAKLQELRSDRAPEKRRKASRGGSR
jgi:tetratricopeptide (TPR) repeat protein